MVQPAFIATLLADLSSELINNTFLGILLVCLLAVLELDLGSKRSY